MGSVETLKMLPEDFAHVRVTDHGKNYEWALIKKIPGDEDGRTFLRTLGPNPNKLQLAKRDRLRANVARYIQLGHNVGRTQSLDPKERKRHLQYCTTVHVGRGGLAAHRLGLDSAAAFFAGSQQNRLKNSCGIPIPDPSS